MPSHRLPTMDKDQTDGLAHRRIVASGGIAGEGQLDELTQRLGSLRMKRNYPFGVGLADGDAQAWVTVWVGVEAVEGESGDLTAAGATPAQEQQCRPLVGVVQALDGYHQPVEVGAWDKPRQA